MTFHSNHVPCSRVCNYGVYRCSAVVSLAYSGPGLPLHGAMTARDAWRAYTKERREVSDAKRRAMHRVRHHCMQIVSQEIYVHKWVHTVAELVVHGREPERVLARLDLLGW